MFVFKKVITAFILPPGIFVVLLLATAVWFLTKRQVKAMGANLVLAGLIWLASTAPVANEMFRGLESDLELPHNPGGDVIILLGGGVYDGVPDMSGRGTPSDSAMHRVVTAARLYRRLSVPVIVSGGKVFAHTDAEALVLKRFLEDLGVPSEKIILEQGSRDTIENARYTKPICQAFGFERPLLVTSAYHMKRAVVSFKKVGMTVMPFPAGFRSLPGRRYGWADILPGSLNGFAVAAKEYLGLFFYKWVY